MRVLKASLCLVAVLAVMASLYWQTLWFGYVWDDSLIFVDRSGLINEPLSWTLLAQPVLVGTSYMRPLAFFSWFLEFNWVGQSPAVSHAVNLAFFLFNLCLVFGLSLKLARMAGRTSPVQIAFCAALIYGIHPALVESTAWISGRFDLLATFFVLLGCFFVLLWPVHTVRGLFLYLVTLICASLSKELGLVMPAIVLCLLWWQFRLQHELTDCACFFRQISGLLLITALFYVLYFLVRKASMGIQYHQVVGVDELVVSLQHLLPLETLKFYLYKAVLPFGSMSLFAPLDTLTPYSVLSLVTSLCVAISLLWLAYRALVKPTISIMLLWMSFFAIVLVLRLVPLGIQGNIGHDRFMALPLAFFVMALTLADYPSLFKCCGLRDSFRLRLFWLVVPVWLAGACFTTATLIPVWQSEFSLWLWAFKQNPKVETVVNNYLNSAFHAGRFDLAEAYLLEKIEKEGGLSVGNQMHYCALLFRKGDKEALKYMEGVMYALPKFHEQANGQWAAQHFMVTSAQMAGFYLNYAMAEMMLAGDLETAEKFIKIAEFYVPDVDRIEVSLGKVAVWYALGKREEAKSIYMKQQARYHYNKYDLSKSVLQVLHHYCKEKPENKAVCEQAEAEGIFEK